MSTIILWTVAALLAGVATGIFIGVHVVIGTPEPGLPALLEGDDWKQAVLDEVAVLHVDAPMDRTPRCIVRRLLATYGVIATDPGVSRPGMSPEQLAQLAERRRLADYWVSQAYQAGLDRDDFALLTARFGMESLITRLQSPLPDALVAGLHDAVRKAQTDGAWSPCPQCARDNTGTPYAHAGRSELLDTHLGTGCVNCGGLGGVWERFPAEDEELLGAEFGSVDLAKERAA